MPRQVRDASGIPGRLEGPTRPSRLPPIHAILTKVWPVWAEPCLSACQADGDPREQPPSLLAAVASWLPILAFFAAAASMLLADRFARLIEGVEIWIPRFPRP